MASGRAGTWLIPGFHAAIDEDLLDGHDDPQNFEMQKFADALSSLRASLSTHASPSSVAVNIAEAATANAAMPSPSESDICGKLNSTNLATLSGGTPLIAGSTGKTYKQLYDECDRTDVFAGRSIPDSGGHKQRCSTDPNRVDAATKYSDRTVVFVAKASVDADGSPVLGGSGWPNNIQTWLEFDPHSDIHFANAEEVAYIAVPGSVPNSSISFRHDAGIEPGDLAIALTGGKCSFGVVGDSGPWFRLGEASMRTHQELGNPQCRVAGQHPCRALRGGDGVGIGSGVTYVIFPGTRPKPLLSQTVNAVAAKLGAEKAEVFLHAHEQ